MRVRDESYASVERESIEAESCLRSDCDTVRRFGEDRYWLNPAVLQTVIHVAYGLKADMLIADFDVRYRVKSGHT